MLHVSVANASPRGGKQRQRPLRSVRSLSLRNTRLRLSRTRGSSTGALIQELDRARELVLAIPLHNDTFGPVNTATATLWELRERIRWLAGAVAGQQREWQKKAESGPESHAPAVAQPNKKVRKVAAISGA